MAIAVKPKAPAITPEEMERRRKMVRSVFRSNAMEGLRLRLYGQNCIPIPRKSERHYWSVSCLP